MVIYYFYLNIMFLGRKLNILYFVAINTEIDVRILIKNYVSIVTIMRVSILI